MVEYKVKSSIVRDVIDHSNYTVTGRLSRDQLESLYCRGPIHATVYGISVRFLGGDVSYRPNANYRTLIYDVS